MSPALSGTSSAAWHAERTRSTSLRRPWVERRVSLGKARLSKIPYTPLECRKNNLTPLGSPKYNPNKHVSIRPSMVRPPDF